MCLNVFEMCRLKTLLRYSEQLGPPIMKPYGPIQPYRFSFGDALSSSLSGFQFNFIRFFISFDAKIFNRHTPKGGRADTSRTPLCGLEMERVKILVI